MNNVNSKIIVAIDGPAGAGKSTIARTVAKNLKITYIDTGAMYRALTYLAIKNYLSFENDMDKILDLAKSSTIELKDKVEDYFVFINGEDVTNLIRTPEITKYISFIASESAIRKIMVKKQQEMGESGGVILEGRDIQTVVFPNADYKIFLDATPEERAERRVRDLEKKGFSDIKIEKVLKDINIRDDKDKSRSAGPLKMAEDAYYLDTTSMSIDEVIKKILNIIRNNEI
ncbi:(d)CMP kinase [Candidatus Dependentiae bacterium]|nr:(d)CMP kinase [Candidatus Dependentiae bacterium]